MLVRKLEMKVKREQKRVHCLNCKHLRITWSPMTPYFCRAWSIRSRRYPCDEVFSASGLVCQKFEPKPKTEQPKLTGKKRKKGYRKNFSRRA